MNNGDNQVHLYNNDNFLGIVNGEAVVLKVVSMLNIPVKCKTLYVLSKVNK